MRVGHRDPVLDQDPAEIVGRLVGPVTLAYGLQDRVLPVLRRHRRQDPAARQVDLALAKGVLDAVDQVVGQLQAELHVTAALADVPRDHVRGNAAVDQGPVSLRLLERMQVRPLHVLNGGQLQELKVVTGMDLDRQLGRRVPGPGLDQQAHGAPAPLAGDDLEGPRTLGMRPRDQVLQHAVALDRAGQLLELLFVEGLARVQRRRVQLLEGD